VIEAPAETQPVGAAFVFGPAVKSLRVVSRAAIPVRPTYYFIIIWTGWAAVSHRSDAEKHS
jgi:hypothetical protein